MTSAAIYNRNNAPEINPNIVNDKEVDIAQTVRGSDFYYAICAVMGAVALGVIGPSYAKPRTDRIFFYITAAINMTACIAYFTMGSNLGWTPIDVEWHRSEGIVAGRNRQIMYVRYIDWFITTPPGIHGEKSHNVGTGHEAGDSATGDGSTSNEAASSA